MPFVANFGAANDYIGLEISEPMIEAARENFNYHPHGNRVTIQSADLRHEFPGVTSSLVLSVLTLQFTPIEYRQQIIRRVFESLAPGGAFILVEKILGATAKLDEAFVNLFLNIKRENGYSESQIDRMRRIRPRKKKPTMRFRFRKSPNSQFRKPGGRFLTTARTPNPSACRWQKQWAAR